MSVERKSWYNPTGDEQVIWDGNPSLVVHAPKIVAGIALGIFGLIGFIYAVFVFSGETYYLEYGLLGSSIISFIFAAFVNLRVKNIHYVITTDRVIRKTGIVGTSKWSKHHDNIVRVDLNVSPLKSMLNTITSLDVGDVVIRSADDRGETFKLANVKSMGRVERLLDDLSNTNTNIAAKYGADSEMQQDTEPNRDQGSQPSRDSHSRTQHEQPSRRSQPHGEFENPDPHDFNEDTDDSDDELSDFEPSSKA